MILFLNSLFIINLRNISTFYRIIITNMDFHPSQIPISNTFDVNDEKDAEEAAEEMVRIGFANKKTGFKVLMPKDSKIAKRVGQIVTTSINYGLRKTKQDRDLRYWTYHNDKDHYAIVLISSKVFDELDF